MYSLLDCLAVGKGVTGGVLEGDNYLTLHATIGSVKTAYRIVTRDLWPATSAIFAFHGISWGLYHGLLVLPIFSKNSNMHMYCQKCSKNNLLTTVIKSSIVFFVLFLII